MEHRRRDELHDRLEQIEQAAIETEIETGVHEDTVEEAKRHIVWRLARISAGAVVTICGVMLIPLPGPGLVVVALGLGILAQDVPFARRLLDKVEDRIPRHEDGTLPTSAKALLVLSVVLAVLFTCVSLWWTFLR
jgi:uncharacterized protein (TIGR02611 family)